MPVCERTICDFIFWFLLTKSLRIVWLKLSRRPLVVHEIKGSIFSCLEPGSCVEILQPLISDGRLGMARYLAPSGWSMRPELARRRLQSNGESSCASSAAVPFPEGPDSFPNSISLYRNAPKCRPGRSLFRSTDSRSPTERGRGRERERS